MSSKIFNCVDMRDVDLFVQAQPVQAREEIELAINQPPAQTHNHYESLHPVEARVDI